MKKWLILLSSIIFMLSIIAINPTKAELSDNYTVYIDAGHGGRDGGASSSKGIEEKGINLNIAMHLGNFLEEKGINVLYTREGDYHLANDSASNKKREDLNNRVNMINKSNADLYVSIHCNSITNSKWNGPQVFYNKSTQNNDLLADKIQNYLNTFTGKERSAKKIRNIFLTDRVKKTGALVEVGFLSNVEEAEKLSTKKYQEQIANNISLAILDYLLSS